MTAMKVIISTTVILFTVGEVAAVVGAGGQEQNETVNLEVGDSVTLGCKFKGN